MNTSRSRTSRLVMAAAGLIAGSVLLTTPAHAAAGDPFDPLQAKVFIVQVSGSTTQLLAATTDGSGSGAYTAQGSAAPLAYNSIAFNAADNYIYGIANSASTSGPAIPIGALIRVGQGNVVTRVGSSTFGANSNSGVVGPGGYLYVSNANAENTMRVINMATGALVTTLNLSSVPAVSDLALVGGYFWGVQNSTKSLVRIDPGTGTVTRFTNVLPAATIAGSAWTYGNGNLGVKNNDPGAVYQFSITNPGSATPGFSLVSTSAFPATPGSDGTAIPGVPPTVTVTTPADGAAYQIDAPVVADYVCGASAVSCVGTLPDGATIDTSTAGDFTFEVTATDESGSTTTVTNTYSVAPVVGTPMINPSVGIAAGLVALIGLGGFVLRRRNVTI